MRTLLLVFLFVPISLLAQRPAAPATGTISGSITCADTNLPARLASVTLEPVRDPASPDAKPAPRPSKSDDAKAPEMISVHRTHLDGTFLIAHVKPGRYYVVAQKPGYLSPVAQFTQEEINHPTPELKEAIARLVPIVDVAPNATSTLSISLVRAASVSGTIRFDDGTAASELYVTFERRNKDGKFVDASLSGHTTDDLGHFHASGVPPGEYRMHTTLNVSDVKVDGVFGGDHMMMSNSGEGIAVFYGDTFHRKDAKTLKIEGGEELTADLTIPVSKIHSLSGALTDARTGHAINAGTVKVFDGDEPEPIASAKVADDEPTFRFEFIPEGEYTVRVKDARDVSREEVPSQPGFFAPSHYKETVLKYYAPYEAPLLVQTDQTGLLLPIPVLKSGPPTPVSDSASN